MIKTRSILWCSLLCLFYSTATLAGFDHTHEPFNQVLRSYLNEQGLVHYARLVDDFKKEAKHPLALYLEQLESVSPEAYDNWNELQKKAFLINAYNALTLKLIINHYPVKSIKDIGSLFTKPWSIKFFKLLGGKIQALDPLEHDVLRASFKDYRIHAAVNCASISCPALRGEAYTASKLEAQLDEQMRLWLADPSRNQIDPARKEQKLSKIFDWYGQDFIKWGGGITSVLKRHSPNSSWTALGDDIKIKYLDYDWRLNQTP